MYAEYYGLSAMPFQLTPDSRFFFGSAGHSRAISHLVYGLAQEEGFIVVTGEVGAGKTTLVERLWSQLDRSTYVIARVMTTQVSADDLLRLAAGAFGVEQTSDKATLLQRIEVTLRAHRAEGRRTLLVVDEVQGLSTAGLEELRMLSNVSEDGRALLQTILLGQPEFRVTLGRPELNQLRQRVLASYHLGPLSPEETRAYIEHRLRAVGWTSVRPIWEDAAFYAIYQHTAGIPRRINRLCSRVLLYGALEESGTITGTMVESTANELQRDIGSDVTPGERPVSRSDKSDLTSRVQTLENTVQRQERVFERLLDLLGTVAHLGG